MVRILRLIVLLPLSYLYAHSLFPQFCIAWKNDMSEGRGEYCLDASTANDWITFLTSKYPDTDHWIESVASLKQTIDALTIDNNELLDEKTEWLKEKSEWLKEKEELVKENAELAKENKRLDYYLNCSRWRDHK